MISKQAFDHAMILLEAKYKEEIHPVIKQEYFIHFSEELTDKELALGVRHCIRYDRFMPTSGRIIEAVKGSLESKATQEWVILVKLAANPQRNQNKLPGFVSSRALAALQGIGGIYVLGRADSYDLNRLERSFKTIYIQSNNSDLKILEQQATRKKSSSEKEGYLGDQVSEMPETLKQEINKLVEQFGKVNR